MEAIPWWVTWLPWLFLLDMAIFAFMAVAWVKVLAELLHLRNEVDALREQKGR